MTDPHQRLLHDLLGPDLAAAFEWQTEIHFSDGRRLQCYQHGPTRRFLYALYDRSIVGFTTHETVQILRPGTSIREVVAGWRDLPSEPANLVELPHSYVRFTDAIDDLELGAAPDE
jgi:hypothetical protein